MTTQQTPDAAVLYETEGNVARITLNRPSAMNSINTAMREQLPLALRQAEADDAVRVIVLRGAGEKAFCAGADITEFRATDSVIQTRAEKKAATWIDELAGTTKPTIASIRGYCLGGGVEIALACDIRIAAANAQFALPEVGLGIIPGAGGTQRLSRVLGVAGALRLILTAERINAKKALQVGLISDLAAMDELASATDVLAALVARNAPAALAYAKEAIRSGAELPLSDGLILERDLSVLLVNSEDRKEGAAAFAERRTPNYRGR